jgi:hypothetical protein
MKNRYIIAVPTIVGIGVFTFADDKAVYAYDGHPKAEMAFAVSASTAIQNTMSGNMIEFPPKERTNRKYITWV